MRGGVAGIGYDAIAVDARREGLPLAVEDWAIDLSRAFVVGDCGDLLIGLWFGMI